jgi:hypothetical protein
VAQALYLSERCACAPAQAATQLIVHDAMKDYLPTSRDDVPASPLTMMDDKGTIVPVRQAKGSQRLARPIAFAAIVFLYLLIILRKPLMYFYNSTDFAHFRSPLVPIVPANTLVPLEAHIMSKCPDTRVGRSHALSQ